MPLSISSLQRCVMGLVVSASLCSTVAAQQKPSATLPKINVSSAERAAADLITQDQLRDYLTFVAHDAMGGRDTPSPGQTITAQFLALQLKRWGFKPAGDNGTFFQTMTFRTEAVDTEKSSLKIGDRSFGYREDYTRFNGSGTASGKFAYATYGWSNPSKGIDPYAGIDIRDKIVVLKSGTGTIFTDPPKEVTGGEFAPTPTSGWQDPIATAVARGAKSVFIVVSPQLERLLAQMGFSRRGTIEGLADPLPMADAKIPIVFIKQSVVDAIFEGESGNLTSTSPFVTTKTGTVTLEASVVRTPVTNVVALWEGSDPKRKAEMVAVGAHYDHIGIGSPNAEGDTINNGADDDGSGTVSVLAMAEALSKTKQRPKRSILLVWHTGEEKGTLGSQYFNKYPTVDIKNVVAQLNIDMIGRSKSAGDTKPANRNLSGPNQIYVIGAGMMSSTLEHVTRATNDAYVKVEYDYRYDDPKDPNRFFFRSDHFNYAQNGIPIVFWFDGVHEDYHGRNDEVDRIDFVKMERIARTIFLTLWKVADLEQRPVVDRKLPAELTRGR